MKFTILPATAEDIPTCFKNGHIAFEHDTNTLFKMHEQGTDDMSSQMPISGFDGLFPPSQPPLGVLYKAVNDETGEIVGHVKWGFWNMDADTSKNTLPGNDYPTVSAPIDPLSRPSFPPDPSLPRWRQCANRQAAHLMTVRDRIRSLGRPVVTCSGITVYPRAQGQGVGTALVKTGLGIADAHHAVMWTHLSNAPGVVKTFERNGWRVVDAITMDLDEWAEKAMPPGREKWGEYTWTAMMREAQ